MAAAGRNYGHDVSCKDRSSGQLDAQEIQGPLSIQIADAMKFVARIIVRIQIDTIK